jgi:hypothetical protein
VSEAAPGFRRFQLNLFKPASCLERAEKDFDIPTHQI